MCYKMARNVRRISLEICKAQFRASSLKNPGMRPCALFRQDLRSTQTRAISQSASLGEAIKDRVEAHDTTISCTEDPYRQEAEKCILCKHQVPVSYKNVQLLSQFVSPNTGRIFGRHITRLCEPQQRRIAKAIRRAVQMGFMPNQYRETVFLKDPSLYDVKYAGHPDIGQATDLPDSPLSQEELEEIRQGVATETGKES
ncbi:uncharacterized protein [Diadema antillarum]|uniref:uncharacterized protein n=1 Tax=Diadema antillarum TaxID=105358 RepID=UPI003A8504EC